MTELYVALVTAGIPAIVTLITSNNQKKENRMHFARNSILTLILEDRIRMINGQAPINYKSVLYEFDEYQKDKGNSYMKEKVNEYIELVKEYEKNISKEMV